MFTHTHTYYVFLNQSTNRFRLVDRVATAYCRHRPTANLTNSRGAPPPGLGILLLFFVHCLLNDRDDRKPTDDILLSCVVVHYIKTLYACRTSHIILLRYCVRSWLGSVVSVRKWCTSYHIISFPKRLISRTLSLYYNIVSAIMIANRFNYVRHCDPAEPGQVVGA